MLMPAESLIAHHALRGWVIVVFPVGGYVLCVGEE